MLEVGKIYIGWGAKENPSRCLFVDEKTALFESVNTGRRFTNDKVSFDKWTEVKEKKKGWINIYENNPYSITRHLENSLSSLAFLGSSVYRTKEEADRYALNATSKRLDCIEIEYEV